MSLRSKHIVGDSPRAATFTFYSASGQFLEEHISYLQFCDLLNKWVSEVNILSGILPEQLLSLSIRLLASSLKSISLTYNFVIY